MDCVFPPSNNLPQVFLQLKFNLCYSHEIYNKNIIDFSVIHNDLYLYSVVVVLVQLVVRKITVELNAQLKMVELL